MEEAVNDILFPWAALVGQERLLYMNDSKRSFIFPRFQINLVPVRALESPIRRPNSLKQGRAFLPAFNQRTVSPLAILTPSPPFPHLQVPW